MELYWVSEFEIGNEYVDLQHRYFLDLITRIGKNFRETNDDDYNSTLAIFKRPQSGQNLIQAYAL